MIIHEINKKLIYQFNDHAEAIIPWAKAKNKSENPLKLISFDHHTDTNSAYLRTLFKKVGRNLAEIDRLRNKRMRTINIQSEESVEHALDGLYHDEHIHAAILLKIISKAIIFQHSYDKPDLTLRERGMHVIPSLIDIKTCSNEECFDHFNLSLEDDHLKELIQQEELDFNFEHPETENFILDIDLDYFKTKKSVLPNKYTLIKKLFNHANIITIANEPNWVHTLALEEGLTTNYLTEKLFNIFKN